MRLSAAMQDRFVASMASLGLVSGVAVSFMYELTVLWRELSVGAVFGLAIGGYLYARGRAEHWRALAFAVLSTLAWWAAERSAVEIFGQAGGGDDFLSGPGLAAGLSGGVIGAFLLSLATALLFPAFRRPRAVIRTVVVGGLAGLLLMLIDAADTGLVLFPPWQAAVACCLALGLMPEDGGPSGP